MNTQHMGATSSPTSKDHQVRGSPPAPAPAPELSDAAKDDGTIWEQFHVNPAPDDPGKVALLERVDHLDELVCGIENKVPGERSYMNPVSPATLEKRCKPAESVLEEVEEKGTLVERVSELERRVLKLQGIISTKSGDSVRVTLTSLSDIEKGNGLAHLHSLDDHSLSRGEEHFHSQEEQDERSSPSIVIDKQEYVTVAVSDPKGHGYEEYAWRDSKKVMLYGPSYPETECAGGGKKGFKMRSKKIKKWLSKHLHMPIPGLTQGKNLLHCCKHPCAMSKQCLKAGKQYTICRKRHYESSDTECDCHHHK